MDTILKEKPWFKEVLKKPEVQDIILKNLYEYYLNNNNIIKILPIITSNSNISIRVIDWFVTNYSKKHNIIYELKDNNANGDKYFNVFLQYKCQLKAYKKRLFDPFCRKQRIAFHYDENKCVVTTTGQLNFFKWAITYDVLKYVENNLESITNDMINSNKVMIKKFNNSPSSSNSSDVNIVDNVKNTNSTESEKTRKKRHELSVSANKTINMHNYSIVLTFE
jgi:hypothetical protein